MEERLLAGPLGVEHSFEVRSRPEGQGPLVVDVAFDGLVPEAQGTSDRVLLRDGRGHVQGGYRDLVAVDATGRELATWMEVRGASVALVIEDATAAYPVRVDPLVWVQTADLTPSDGPNDDSFGGSVASSGNTVVVGNAGHTVDGNFEQGAAYIFVRDGATWTQQAELTASDGAAGDGFAVAVAVNGDTVIVGASGAPPGGRAYVFVRNGGNWTQQAELTPSDAQLNGDFGCSVAVSGGTAVVGASYYGQSEGAAYVFVQNGTTWTEQAELAASDGATSDIFGVSTAVSGGTAIVGAPYHQVGANRHQGAAYVFVQSANRWTQQAELTASDGAVDDMFGFAVAESGVTVLIGA